MTTATTRWSTRRRGLTLVELLVTLALMLLIMTVIVKIFQESTTAMTTARTDQDLAMITRRIDETIRQDLKGVTAEWKVDKSKDPFRFIPPNPNQNLGYFEVGENSFADEQGEDTDDYLAFTAKAPAGQPFTGRVMLPRGPGFAQTVITSEHAEIIYFLRHGNLYRRVLLIVPQALVDSIQAVNGADLGGYDENGDNVSELSWQGGNDVSVRAPAFGTTVPTANTLGDLTNRENRSFRPRFSNDHYTPGSPPTESPDGVADDVSGPAGAVPDGVPDYWPTLNPGAFAAGYVRRPVMSADSSETLAFPYIFPPRYSRSADSPNRTGPYANPAGIHGGPIVAFGPPRVYNHSPLDLGDNLPVPATTDYWTYWGFPTWRETRAPIWTAANRGVNSTNGQLGYGMSRTRQLELLPRSRHWYSDGAGRVLGASSNPAEAVLEEFYPNADNNAFPNNRYATASRWLSIWASSEEDLIATNVRSFDVKVFDPYLSDYNVLGIDMQGDGTFDHFTPRYVDLGYASQIKPNATVGNAPYTFAGETTFHTEVGEDRTMGHEGRMPPLTTDNRNDSLMASFGYSFAIGEDSTDTVRMRRTWDSWSTDYSHQLFPGIDPSQSPPFQRPVYPNYPPPYPAPLYGIQIQIRIASPENQKTKILTIRQDFSDKL